MWTVDHRTDTRAGEVAWGMAGNGPSLVLAHGWPWSSFSWHRVISLLAKSNTVYWFDMPGYGRSEMPARASTALDVQGEVFAEMLKIWGLENPCVVAHDMSGAVTLRAHLLHGVDYRALVMMNVVALNPWGSEFFDHVRRHVDAFVGVPPHIHRAIVGAYIEGALINDLAEDDFQQLCDPWLSAEGRVSFYRQFAQADERYTSEFAEKLDQMRCPVAILWGEKDPWIPLSRGRQLHAIMPGSTFEVLKDVGHLPQLEAPDLAGRRILASIETLSPSGVTH